MRERFATRVATPEMIEAAVRESAERLELELNADRVRALSRIRGRLPGSGRTAEEERLGWDVDSARDAWADMDRSSRGAGRSSMMMAMGSLAASTVAGEAAAVVAGSAALAAGGAAAGAAGAGAAGGSVVPVVGTAVGFAAGLTVGAAVDWWMTGSLERGIRASIDAGLEQTRRHLVDGRGDPFEDKVPFNYHGFAPGVTVSLGWQFTREFSMQAIALGAAGVMFQLAIDLR